MQSHKKERNEFLNVINHKAQNLTKVNDLSQMMHNLELSLTYILGM